MQSLQTVTIEGAGFSEIWKPYNHPEGFGVHGALICRHTGECKPLLANRMFRIGSIEGPLRPIFESIPTRILEVVASYDHYPVELTGLASLAEDDFLRLHKQNPFLLLLVARSVARDSLWPVKHWASLLNKSWSVISEAMGYHRSTGKLAVKVKDTKLWAYGYLQMFLTATQKPGMPRLLRHIQTVTLDVLTVALSLADEATDCPTLLRAASQNETMIPNVTEDASAIIQVRERMKVQPYWPYKSVPEQRILSYWRARLEETAMRDGVEVITEYPPPPLSPDSEWDCIITADQLKDFAEKWRNCALSYHWRLLTGVTAIFFERGDSPLSICVVLDRDGEDWHVSEVLMPDNQPPSADVEERVRADFEDALNAE